MSFFWSRFKKDRLALFNYFFKHTLFLVSSLFLLHHFDIGFTALLPVGALYFVVPLSICVGLKITTWMHNCMHYNYKHGNQILGELSSFYALMSFGIISNLHVLHHSYPDTEQDPHNPEGLSFVNLFFTSQFRGVQIIENKFYEFHGRTPTNFLIFKTNIFMHFLGNVLRLAIWYQLMGTLFYSMYLPGLLAYLFVFNHLNFATHITDKNGNVQVLNIDSNLYYKTMNWICEGLYFHHNHHIYPRRTNPSRPSGLELRNRRNSAFAVRISDSQRNNSRVGVR